VNKETDVLSFPQNSQFILGDIVISSDAVYKGAKKYKRTINEELARLITHGILHLIGYNDKTYKEFLKMRNKENEIISNLL
jgi:probable rRNA maturation factor